MSDIMKVNCHLGNSKRFSPCKQPRALNIATLGGNITGRSASRELLNYILTPWRRALLEKLTGFQLVKIFPAFYGTRRFITAFTSARHLSLSWASSIQSIPPTSHFLKIHLTSELHSSGNSCPFAPLPHNFISMPSVLEHLEAVLKVRVKCSWLHRAASMISILF